mgnify:CR=1 FL=1
MADCLFCKIAAKQIPASIVHEDADLVAFKDIAPQAPVHVLIVPRVHIESLNALDESHGALMGRIIVVAAKLARDLGLAEGGYRLVTNCGPDAGQTVFHLHTHLLGGTPLSGRMG